MISGALALFVSGCGSDAGGSGGGGGTSGGTGGGAGRGGGEGGGAGLDGSAGSTGTAGAAGPGGAGGPSGDGGPGGGVAGSSGGGGGGAGSSGGAGGAAGAAGGDGGVAGVSGSDGGLAGIPGGDGGGGAAGSTATYSGCILVGGAGDRAGITKRDTVSNRCFRLTFDNIVPTQVPGLTLPQGWGNGQASAYSNATCSGAAIPGASVSGTVAWSAADAGIVANRVDVDVVMTFPPSGAISGDETLRVDGLPMNGPCP